MPVSDYHHISDVLHVVEQVNPKTILDIGVGFGKWGILCREVLDVYNERLQPKDWLIKIDGVEIFEAYRNPLWQLAYNQIFIGDALDLIDGLGYYDLILICDVIEHFDKATGSTFLKKLLARGNIVIVTSPQGYMPQGVVWENVHEAHKSGWSVRDFAEFPHLYKNIGATFMAVLSKEDARIKALNVSNPLQNLGVKKGVGELLKIAKGRFYFRMNQIFVRSFN